MKQFVNAGGYAYVFDEEGNLWLSSMKYNGLIKYDINTKEIEYIKQFSNYAITECNLHGAAKRIQNRLFFFPLVSNHIHIYDIENENETSIEIPKKAGANSFFREIYEYDDFFLIFPSHLNGTIWKINSSTEVVSRHEELTNFINQYTIEERKNSAIAFEGNQMIISLPNRREILILDLISYNKRAISLDIGYTIQHMVKKNNNLFVTVSDVFNIYMINLETGESEKYFAFENASSDRERKVPFSDIFFIDKFIFVSNYYAKSICLVDENRMVLDFNKMFLKEQKIEEKDGGGAVFCGMIEKEGKIFFVPGRASHLIEFDYQTQDCKCIKFMITKFRNTKVENEFVNQLISYQIEGLLTLKDLISICNSSPK